MMNHRLSKGVSVILVALLMSAASAPAHSVGNGVVERDRKEASLSVGERVAWEDLMGLSVEEQAEVLWPMDSAAREDFIALAQSVDDGSGGHGSEPQAVPAALAPLVAPLGLCVAGGLGGVALNEIVSLVRHGDWATADARIDSAITGCISTVVPPMLRPLVNKAKGPIKKAVLKFLERRDKGDSDQSAVYA